MLDNNRQDKIDEQREMKHEQALRRQWTIEDRGAKAQKPDRYDILEAIDKDENGEPLTRNERRMLTALDMRIAKDARRKAFREGNGDERE